jgi:molybdate transport system substrate-binding protein
MGLLAKRLAAGEVFDVLILTPEALQPLEQRGTVAPGMVTPLGRVGIGVVVNEKAPVPQIGSAEMLRQTLLRARSVIYIDPSIGTSGKYVAQMINRLGITEQMKAKTTLGTGGYVVEPVGRGEIELGIHQISEMLPVRGVRLVGELPPEFQHYTMYVAAIPENAKEKDAAGALIRFLTGSHAKQTFRDAGILPP